MEKLPVFEDFIPLGFGSNNSSSFTIGSTAGINTGYNMSAIAGPIIKLGNHVAEQAAFYHNDEDPSHTAEDYINEAKKHINQKIDEVCETYSMNDSVEEAMVQIAGKSKPSGAQVLATVIVDYLNNNLILPSNANKKKIIEEIKQLIIDSTF